MDTDLATGLIVNPSEVKVEPVSPAPSPSVTPAPPLAPVTTVQTKLEPELCHIKQEPRQTQSPSSGLSVLKQPSTIVISTPGGPGVTRTLSSSTARLLVPKLPANTTVKLEASEQRWRLGQNSGGRILVTGGLKSSTRRVIDSHLISSHTVRVQYICMVSGCMMVTTF